MPWKPVALVATLIAFGFIGAPTTRVWGGCSRDAVTFDHEVTARRVDDPHQFLVRPFFRIAFAPLRHRHDSCGALRGPELFNFQLPRSDAYIGLGSTARTKPRPWKIGDHHEPSSTAPAVRQSRLRITVAGT